MLRKETLQKVLLNAVDAIDAGHSNYTSEEMDEILDTVNRIVNTENKLSKYQACDYLNISRATFDNYVKAGKIPEGMKQIGFKEKFWTKGSLNEVKYELEHKTRS